MRLLRPICISAAMMALFLTQALPAFQSDQAAGTATQTERKAKAKTRKAAETTSDIKNQSGATAAESKAAGAARNAERNAQPAEPQAMRKARSSHTGSAARAVPTVSESEIAAAKASGKVWVNTETGVYHKGGQWYGATKQGKFMTEDEATRAGYRAAKGK